MDRQSSNKTTFSFFNDDCDIETQPDNLNETPSTSDPEIEEEQLPGESLPVYEAQAEDRKPIYQQQSPVIPWKKEPHFLTVNDKEEKTLSSLPASEVPFSISESLNGLINLFLDKQSSIKKPDNQLYSRISTQVALILREIRLQDLPHDFKSCLFLTTARIIVVATFLKLEFTNISVYKKFNDLMYNVYSGMIVLNDTNYIREINLLKLFVKLEQMEEVEIEDGILDTELVLLNLLDCNWESNIKQIDKFFISKESDLLCRLLTIRVYYIKIEELVKRKRSQNNKTTSKHMGNLFTIIKSLRAELLGDLDNFLFKYEIEEEDENTGEYSNDLTTDKFLLLERKIIDRFKQTTLISAIKAKIGTLQKYTEFSTFYKMILKEFKLTKQESENKERRNLLVYSEGWDKDVSFRSVFKSAFSFKNKNFKNEEFIINGNKYKLTTQINQNIIQLISPLTSHSEHDSKSKTIKKAKSNDPSYQLNINNEVYYFGDIYRKIFVYFDAITFKEGGFALDIIRTQRFINKLLIVLKRLTENINTFTLNFIIELELPYTEVYKFTTDYNLTDTLRQLNEIVFKMCQGFEILAELKFIYTPFVIVKSECFFELNTKEKDQFKEFIKEILTRNKNWISESLNSTESSAILESEDFNTTDGSVSLMEIFDFCYLNAFNYLKNNCSIDKYTVKSLIQEINGLFLNFSRELANKLKNTKESNNEMNLPIILKNIPGQKFCIFYKVHRELINEIESIKIYIDYNELSQPDDVNKNGECSTILLVNRFVNSLTITNESDSNSIVKYKKEQQNMSLTKDSFVLFLIDQIEKRCIDELYEGEKEQVYITIYTELLLEWFTENLETKVKKCYVKNENKEKTACEHCKDNLFIG